MAEYMNWAQTQQPQPSYLSALSGFSNPTEYLTTETPQMFGNATSPMDWTQSASSQLGSGGFTGAGLTAAPQQSWQDFLFGNKNNPTGIQTMGAASPIIQGMSGLMNGFMAMKQYGLSKDIFNNNKQQFERNFGAQKGITNSQLSDRQDRRNADARANGMTGTTSTADYMSKWGVK